MATGIWAGAAYAVIIFLIGFIFGTVRILLLIPHLGEAVSVSVEAPFMLATSWFACRWCVDQLNVAHNVGAGIAMAVVAFTVLMLLELGLSVLVFGRSATKFVMGHASLPGMISLTAQIAFAIFPVVQVRRGEE